MNRRDAIKIGAAGFALTAVSLSPLMTGSARAEKAQLADGRVLDGRFARIASVDEALAGPAASRLAA